MKTKIKTETMEHKRILCIMNAKEYNITGYTHGIITYASNVREARNIFRRSYPHENIFYSKLAGKINPKHI